MSNWRFLDIIINKQQSFLDFVNNNFPLKLITALKGCLHNIISKLVSHYIVKEYLLAKSLVRLNIIHRNIYKNV